MNKTILNPTVLTLGLISLFADIASEMLYPITPIFLTSVLGASMFSVGVIEGTAEAIASLLKSYSGLWSDRIQHRRYFVISGYSLSAISKPLIGLATGWWFVLFCRGLDRTGKGIRTAPRDALLAESVSAENMGAAFGWHRMMDTTGAIVGPLLALWFLQSYKGDLRSIFLWALIPGIISVVFAATLKETKKSNKSVQAKWTWKNLPSPFKRYLLAWTVFSLGNSSDVFLLMKVKTSGADTTTVILMYCLYNFTYAFTSPYLGELSDKIGRKKTLSFGLVVFALVYLGFIFGESNLTYFALFAIYGLYMAGTEGIGKALAIDLMPADRKATAIGVLGTLTGLATLVASCCAGALWDHVSFKATFLLGVIASLIALLLLQRINPNKLASENA